MEKSTPVLSGSACGAGVRFLDLWLDWFPSCANFLLVKLDLHSVCPQVCLPGLILLLWSFLPCHELPPAVMAQAQMGLYHPMWGPRCGAHFPVTALRAHTASPSSQFPMPPPTLLR